MTVTRSTDLVSPRLESHAPHQLRCQEFFLKDMAMLDVSHFGFASKSDICHGGIYGLNKHDIEEFGEVKFTDPKLGNGYKESTTFCVLSS